MSKKKLLIYKSPLDQENKPYWVPVVIKNKDTLIGTINGLFVVASEMGLDPEGFYSILSSERFNDTLRDGRHGSDLSDFEFKKYIKDMLLDDMEKVALQETHEECSPDILADNILNISCTCGNFYGFKDFKDIPDENMNCGVCGKIVIEYTNKDDEDYTYDGKEHLKRDLDDVIEEVKEELDMYRDDEEDGLSDDLSDGF